MDSISVPIQLIQLVVLELAKTNTGMAQALACFVPPTPTPPPQEQIRVVMYEGQFVIRGTLVIPPRGKARLTVIDAGGLVLPPLESVSPSHAAVEVQHSARGKRPPSANGWALWCLEAGGAPISSLRRD